MVAHGPDNDQFSLETHVVLVVLPVVCELDHAVAALPQHAPLLHLVLVELHVVPARQLLPRHHTLRLLTKI